MASTSMRSHGKHAPELAGPAPSPPSPHMHDPTCVYGWAGAGRASVHTRASQPSPLPPLTCMALEGTHR